MGGVVAGGVLVVFFSRKFSWFSRTTFLFGTVFFFYKKVMPFSFANVRGRLLTVIFFVNCLGAKRVPSAHWKRRMSRLFGGERIAALSFSPRCFISNFYFIESF